MVSMGGVGRGGGCSHVARNLLPQIGFGFWVSRAAGCRRGSSCCLKARSRFELWCVLRPWVVLVHKGAWRVGCDGPAEG